MGLRRYLIKRIGVSVLILWVIASINFMIFVWYPGDPTAFILGSGERIKPEVREMILEKYGLRDPLIIRYLKYLRNMFTFGMVEPYFGVSYATGKFVAFEMADRLKWTILLLGSALVGDIILGLLFGMLAGIKRGTKVDATVIAMALFTWGVPAFFIQLLGISFFVHILNFQYGIKIFPRGGPYDIPPPTDPFQLFLNIIWHFSLPVLTLVISGFGSWALYSRNMLLDALTQDFILTARAKGLKERTVLFKHAFKSILPPVATLITLSIPGIVTGAIITETIFQIPGIGKWYLDSLYSYDYPVVQAVLFVYATLVVLCNFIADVLYGILDPRIRVGARR
ncbi:MAG: ABC transporter permease [Candidatus Baldrarchaeia archaeon]